MDHISLPGFSKAGKGFVYLASYLVV